MKTPKAGETQPKPESVSKSVVKRRSLLITPTTVTPRNDSVNQDQTPQAKKTVIKVVNKQKRLSVPAALSPTAVTPSSATHQKVTTKQQTIVEQTVNKPQVPIHQVKQQVATEKVIARSPSSTEITQNVSRRNSTITSNGPEVTTNSPTKPIVNNVAHQGYSRMDEVKEWSKGVEAFKANDFQLAETSFLVSFHIFLNLFLHRNTQLQKLCSI